MSVNTIMSATTIIRLRQELDRAIEALKGKNSEIEHLLQIRDDLMAQHTKALKVKDQKIKEAYFQGGQDMESKLLPTIEAKDQRITALEKAICDYVAADGAEPDTLLTDALSEDTRKEASREKA